MHCKVSTCASSHSTGLWQTSDSSSAQAGARMKDNVRNADSSSMHQYETLRGVSDHFLSMSAEQKNKGKAWFRGSKKQRSLIT